MKAFSIVGWDDLYETAETKKLKNLSWVPTPNSHNSLGFCELLSHPNGMAHYGAWNLILQVASKCPVRGLLVSGRNKVHDARSIALITRGSERMIQEAIPRLVEIGWLAELELGESPGTPGEDPGKTGEAPGTPVLKGREGKGKEWKGREAASAAPPPGCALLISSLKAAKAAGTEKREVDALNEWIEWLTNEVGCESDDENAEIIRWAGRETKERGVEMRYARHMTKNGWTEAAKIYLKDWRKLRGAS